MKLLTEYSLFDYKQDDVEKSLEENNGFLVLSGIIQKANALNQNGRVYPRHILEREVRNYQKFILENRALGALDHPECLPGTAKILTATGWKSMIDVKDGEKVYSLDPEKGVVTLDPILRKVESDYTGKMIQIKNIQGSLEMNLTPNHRVLLWDRYNKPHYKTAQEIYDLWKAKSSWLNHCSVRRGGTWIGESPKNFTIPDSDIQIPIETWVAFFGIWLAEGHVQGSKKGFKPKYGYKVAVHQHKQNTVEEIRTLMKKLPFAVHEYEHDNGKVAFEFTNKALHAYLSKFGHSGTKFIPEEIKSLSPELLNILLEWMLKGDGWNRKCPKGNLLREYYTTSKRLAEDVTDIMLKLGRGASMHYRTPVDRLIDNNRVILATNSERLYVVHEHTTKGSYLQRLEIKEIDSPGKVYCVTTVNGTFLTKNDDFSFSYWTGNSAVVELKTVSHMMIEARMEGDIVYGKLKVLNTSCGKELQALIKDGVKIGISSRGVGSLKKEGDQNVVQEDFQLICWDVVSEPSTPGAFVMKEGKEISPEELKAVFSKQDRIARALNDILSLKK